MNSMNLFNFCIHENKVFDLDGYEILPDEDNVVTIVFNGLERRFKIDKMIVWLKESGYHKLFRAPKIPKLIKGSILKDPKPIKEKLDKVPKVKIPRVKKEKPTKIPRVKKEPKKQYVKVEFDKRKIKGKENNNGYPKRKVICSNGKEYNSLYEAGKELGLTRSQIWHVCTGKWKHSHGLTFKYA